MSRFAIITSGAWGGRSVVAYEIEKETAKLYKLGRRVAGSAYEGSRVYKEKVLCLVEDEAETIRRCGAAIEAVDFYKPHIDRLQEDVTALKKERDERAKAILRGEDIRPEKVSPEETPSPGQE